MMDNVRTKEEILLALEFGVLAFYGLACWQTPDIE